MLLFYVFSFTFRTDISFNQDLGRHLKLGEIILNKKSIPKTNLFSYTYPEFPFINHHFLFEVLIFIGSSTIGLNAMLLVKLIIILVSILFIFFIIGNTYWYVLLPVSFIFLHTLRERVELRPEICSFLFTVIYLYLLELFARKQSKLLYLLPLVSFLWVNTHIYFPVGLLLLCIYIANFLKVRDFYKFKKCLLVLFVSVVLSFINPNGFHGLIYPFNIFQNYGYAIVENQTLFKLEEIGFQDKNIFFAKIAILFSFVSLIILAELRKVFLKETLLILFGVSLALLNVRSFPYLVFISLPAMLLLLNKSRILKLKYFTLPFITISITLLPLLFYESTFYLNGDYYKFNSQQKNAELKYSESAKNGLDFFIANHLPGPIFNNFDIGSYILYRGYPKIKVFVDGRPEGYPASFFQEVYIPIQDEYDEFIKATNKYNFQTVVFSITDQTPWGIKFLSSITKDNNWKIVYLDNFIIILVQSKVVEEKELEILDLNNFQFQSNDSTAYFYLGNFLLKNGYIKSAKKFTERGLEIFPDSPFGNSLLFYSISQDRPDKLTEDQLLLQKRRNPFWW